MGYDIHITRQKNWLDEDDAKRISLKEWNELLSNDPDMRMDNFAEATTTNGDTIIIESDGLSCGQNMRATDWLETMRGLTIRKEIL